VVAEVSQGGPDWRGEMRALPALWRDPERRWPPAVDAGPLGTRVRPAGAAGRDASRRRPQRAGLRAPDLEARQRSARLGTCSGVRAVACITAYPSRWDRRGDGGGDLQGRAPAMLKIKLGGDGERQAHRRGAQAAPESELIVDANEDGIGQSGSKISPNAPKRAVTLVEQPLPAGQDKALGAHPPAAFQSVPMKACTTGRRCRTARTL